MSETQKRWRPPRRFLAPLNINIPSHPDMFYLSESIVAMSNGKARRDLGWNPQSLDNELNEAVQFFEANRHLER